MGPQYILVFAVCFLASLLGPLCGIGGGVIIKPVVDAMNVMSVSTVSFLSSMSVLIMSLSTLAQNAASGQSDIDARAMSPIAVSSAVGGVIGKMLFNRLGSVFPDAELVGAVQAAVLIVLAVLVLAYTLNKARIKGLKLENAWAQALIGFCAGACWSFLGIGAAPSTWPSSSSSSPWRASPPRSVAVHHRVLADGEPHLHAGHGQRARVPPRGPAGHGGDGGAWVGRGAPPAAPDGLGGGR